MTQWRSKYSGSFKTRITIDGEEVIGSPTQFTLASSTPDLSKSELFGDSVNGDGPKQAVAGHANLVRIKVVDEFENTALPGDTFKFGMSFGKDKDKLSNAKPHGFQGYWEAGDTGVYSLTFTPTQAGSCEMHMWCDPYSKGERIALPGSPFHVSVSAGVPSAAVSVVGGFTKLFKEEKTDKCEG